MKRLACLVACLLVLSFQPERGLCAHKVVVGVYQNKPMVFHDEDGQPRGLFIDVLEGVAAARGWDLEYRLGSWRQAFNRLLAGEIDVLPVVAYTLSRAEHINFNKDNLLSNWGQVYTREGAGIQSLFDLRDRTVGLLAGDVHNEAFQRLLEQFQVPVRPVEYDSYRAVFRAVEEGEVEAGVVNRLVATRYEGADRVWATPIVFNPIEIRFGVSKTAPPWVLEGLDQGVADLKARQGSTYYRSLEKWFGGGREAKGLPDWVVTVALAVGLALVFFAVANLVLRRQVALKTRELAARNRELEREAAERTRMEGALKVAKEAAEAASRAKSEFLATMSHEIRTPLNGVLGMLQLLQVASLNTREKDMVDTALGAGRSLMYILGDILDLSMIEAGRLRAVKASFRFADVVAPVLQSFRDTAERKGLVLEFQRHPGVPDALVGDEGRLRQVLFNLVGNAVKFTDAGLVRLEASPLRSPEPGRTRLLFMVSDTGIGIPDDKMPDVFKPFTQVEAAMTRKHPGTGLGLGLVERLVTLMDGTLAIESETGTGTVVYLTLDFDQPEDACEAEEAESLVPETGPRRILVVEDEPVNRQVAERLLQARGYETVTAENGVQALEALTRESFDLVLMDILMPVMDGEMATRRIRLGQVPGCPADMPVVALTAYAMKGDKDRLAKAGVDGYLAKPLEMDDLYRVVASVLARKRHRE